MKIASKAAALLMLTAACQEDGRAEGKPDGEADSAVEAGDAAVDATVDPGQDAELDAGNEEHDAGKAPCDGGARAADGACASNDECPNDCSGHGSCSANVCACAAGYTGGDCHECATGWMASGAQCVPKTGCGPEPCAPGATECNGISRRSCAVAADGCPKWSEWATCADKHCVCPFQADPKVSIQQWGVGLGNNAIYGLALSATGALFGTGAVGLAGMGDMSAAFVGELTDPPPAAAWSESWGGHYSAGNGIAIDTAGSVFVGGTWDQNATFGGGFLRKWQRPAEVAWTAKWDTPASDEVRAVAIGPGGDLFVAGFTEGALSGSNAGMADAFLSRVTAAGSVSWTKQWGANTADYAFGLVADPAGSVYVVGTLSEDAFCRKFDANGDEQWTARWTSSEYDAAYGVQLVDGGVVVVGQAQGAVGSAANTGSFVARVGTDGSVQWTRYFSAPNTKFDAASAIKVTASGELLIAGQTWGALVAGAHQGGTDAYLQKRASDGTVLWTKQVGGAGTEEVSALALNGDGTITVAGRTTRAFPGFSSGLGNSSFLIRFAP